MSETQADFLLRQIVSSRGYTEKLLDHVEPDHWFAQPAGSITHIAWQVGHLATTQYSLALRRIRGERDEDEQLISTAFRTLFGKGSTPSFDPQSYPAPAEIRQVFERVHKQVIRENRKLPAEVLDEPSVPEHPMFQTRGGALRWCAQHEMLHAGQIGLIRRMLGERWVR